MGKYVDIFIRSFGDYAHYLWQEVTLSASYKEWYANYFYGLIFISGLFFLWELMSPWRRGQKPIRKDFWLDVFYMFFNFFLFWLIIYNAVSNVVVEVFKTFCVELGFANGIALKIESLPLFLKLLFAFVIKDFIHWNVHRLLHRVSFLWQFHKLHHSVQEMGFAAHLRFHWIEIVIYNSIQYIPMAILGFGLDEYFVVHMFALFVGHFNHSNVKLSLGPLKYIFNNPQMHLWHHAKEIPEKNGVNFGLTLSCWDYLFGTAYMPSENAEEELGFKDIERYPKGFFGQMFYPFRSYSKK